MSPARADTLRAGAGEMARLVATHDWARTPLGPSADWPETLRVAVDVCLASRFPIVLFWGQELVLVYNDAYSPFLGPEKHPAALGGRARDVWSEIWDVISPMFDEAMLRGNATWSDDQLLLIDREGVEESYFTFSYSPVSDGEGGIAGVFCAVTETTRRVLGERRLRMLRELAASTADARAVEDACRRAVAALAANVSDVPFATLTLLDAVGTSPAASFGSPPVLTPEQLARVSESGSAERFDGLAVDVVLPLVDRVTASSALALPIQPTGQDVRAVLVAGISPVQKLDDDYRAFFELVAGQIATALGDAGAYEAERERAERLAELDHAKTAFFSNVSHEFRTPLTLMLGPLEDALARRARAVPDAVREDIEVAHRNALRLLKLVNTLLDFSRIEAGRVEASYEQLDLATTTADLASVFRSAVERAGLVLEIDCPALDEPVWVDREMWEKIVLNLISNAFKFTFEGRIAVRLRETGGRVRLEVTDTGVGIPTEEQPHLFERFHRVQDARSRSHEGSGIGLALVQELVHLHGGTITVASVPGRGTTFTVEMPTGSAHLPPDHLVEPRPAAAATARTARPFVVEALSWLRDEEDRPSAPLLLDEGDAAPPPSGRARGRVLLADDNADMRDYVSRLLRPSYDVEAVADGRAALDSARARPPDLVLVDVMMPGLDGLGLVRALRAEPATRATAVVLLSARAGEEAKLEGLETGADDYLVKPFSANELLARVRTQVDVAVARRDREARQSFVLELGDALRTQVDEDEVGALATRMLAEHLQADRCYVVRASRGEDRAWVGPEHRRRGHAPITGEYRFSDFPESIARLETEPLFVTDVASDPSLTEVDKASFGALGMASVIAAPLRKGERNFIWMLVVGCAGPRTWTTDELHLVEEVAERTWAAAERARADAAVRTSEELYRTLFESIDEGLCVVEVLFDEDDNAVDYRFLEVNPSFERQTGVPDPTGRRALEVAGDHEAYWFETFGRVALTGEAVRFEGRADALGRWFDVFAFRVDDPAERHVAILFNDITARKRAEATALREHRVAAELAERERWARELHDATLQSLGAMHMKLVAALADGDRTSALVAEAADIAHAEIGNLRALIAELHPPVLARYGLETALGTLAGELEARGGPTVDVSVRPAGALDGRLPRGLELTVYRVVQEALTNAAGHAGATSVELVVRWDDATLEATIRDDGSGFDPSRPTAGFGLVGMHERAALAGGTLDVRSVPGEGTVVTLVVPVSRPAETRAP